MKIHVDCESCADLGQYLAHALNESDWREASQYCLELEAHYRDDHDE